MLRKKKKKTVLGFTNEKHAITKMIGRGRSEKKTNLISNLKKKNKKILSKQQFHNELNAHIYL